jgi:hypothetical protein
MKQADISAHRDPVPVTTFALKVSPEWNDWLDRFSEETRLPRPVLVEGY